MPSPAKKLVKPILLVIPSITSISKKKKKELIPPMFLCLLLRILHKKTYM
jgi:hypothetical protein